MAESFVFSLDRDADEMIVGQYDLLQGGKDDMTAYYQAGKRKQQMANEYEAPKNIRLRSVGVDTYADNTTVRFDVYRTKPDYRNPTQGQSILKKRRQSTGGLGWLRLIILPLKHFQIRRNRAAARI